ncbi:abortive infection system antitoxin AbiGi family protein [Clostridium beijerinckii]|uniref:Abortive phage resistance protein AbiGi, antitoxin n=1 Tax=Clostridium beijerinckii TaxID=1520 RepID=A0AAE5LRQ0_CLOBE|nr:abortive infection system antitoxin AbiGi family protein [Clostridium beijerinckii]NSB15955.1 hypothetical protein [Clostridium beijerinckii]OOM33284.1 hypothetical protein CLOBE_06220 [Clostridium beijerinckii]
MENKDIIRVKNIEEKNENVPRSKQSANVLFKFMKELRFLKEILENKAIIPRYYEESIEYLKISELEKIVFPMVCFCDINVSRLKEHVQYYGKFGIGLNKKWGINKGIQCINYINPESEIRKDFTYLFTKAFNQIDEDDSLVEYNSYLLNNLLFMKPLAGRMLRNNKYDKKNFTDEREWRYVPKIEDNDKIQLIIPPIFVGQLAVYNTYSDALKKLKNLWLTFKYEDIEYLMVASKMDRKRLVDFIIENNNVCCSDAQKYELISKIMVYNVISKDW